MGWVIFFIFFYFIIEARLDRSKSQSASLDDDGIVNNNANGNSKKEGGKGTANSDYINDKDNNINIV